MQLFGENVRDRDDLEEFYCSAVALLRLRRCNGVLSFVSINMFLLVRRNKNRNQIVI